jgi:hypothetical protein
MRKMRFFITAFCVAFGMCGAFAQSGGTKPVMAATSEKTTVKQTPAVKPVLATGSVNVNNKNAANATQPKVAPQLAAGANKNGAVEQKK